MRINNLLGLTLISLLLIAVPVQGTALVAEYAGEVQREGLGAKRITPVLDILGEELERVGIKILDNAVYSMERLWHDTVNWNISGKKTKT
ncbi:MAG TPA: hypothetical protein VNU93_06285 [Verrucomicrobiae bacterium]|nr:hypothetical protein [Verrucomicrobiae bacterium]